MPSPIRWVPTLYFVQGLQFFVVNLILGLMLKSQGVANDRIAYWTATLGLAWAFKPLWSPFLELVRSKKAVVVATQYTGAALLAFSALALQMPFWFAALIGAMFVFAFSSATHDIACDGLYMASLDERAQARYSRWKELTPEQKNQARRAWRRYQQLSPDQQARVRDGYHRFKKLSPEQRRRLRERWQNATPEERQRWLERRRARQERRG